VALAEAAQQVAAAITLPAPAHLLVTSDAELAASDVTYLEVDSGLEALETAARGLLDKLEVAVDREAEEAGTREALPVAAAVQAFAAALPGALSLFAAHRALASSELAVEDLSAAAATAGALRKKLDADANKETRTGSASCTTRSA